MSLTVAWHSVMLVKKYHYLGLTQYLYLESFLMLMDEDDTILSFILIRKMLFSNNSPGVWWREVSVLRNMDKRSVTVA